MSVGETPAERVFCACARVVTSYALKLAPLTFVRPGELRHATWPELALDDAEWRIPDR